VEAAAERAGVPVSWEPFLLGPIFKEQGWDDSPFNLYPAKGRYMWHDMERLCDGYGIPFARPTRFPRSGLLAARVACLASAASEPWLPDFCLAVFRANFAEDREIGDPAVIGDILGSLGLSGWDVIERAQIPENKEILRDRTRRAMTLGIFGAPSFLADEELFWGNDRLEDALMWLQPRRRSEENSASELLRTRTGDEAKNDNPGGRWVHEETKGPEDGLARRIVRCVRGEAQSDGQGR
jgi:2-hydroxychromene-2-carboxylate isomerase